MQSHHGRLWLQSGAPGATEFRFWLPLEQAIPIMTAVFVIDDQNSVRHALGEMLRVFGFTVEVFDSADRFLQTVAPGRAGCVVADVRMPGMDGIELVRELARRKIALPVVLISGHADVPMAVAGIKAGAEDFIEKPIDDRQLVAAINRGLARTFEQQVSKQSQDALGRQLFAADAAAGRDLRPGRQRLHQPGDRLQARHQHPHGRELPRPDHGKDAGRERRGAGPAGDPARADRSVELPSQSLRLPRNARRQ